MISAIRHLQRINEGVAIAAGLLLLASVLVTLFDVAARPFAAALGGTDELSGYAMAIATGWGMSHALTRRAHVRIDLLRSRCRSRLQAMFDLVAMLSLAGTALVIAYRVWPVLSRSLQNNSTANTTLETPLWIPQSLWMAGWVWFAISSLILCLCAARLLLQGDTESVNELIGQAEDT